MNEKIHCEDFQSEDNQSQELSSEMLHYHDLHGCYFEDLQLGMVAMLGKTVTDADVLMFAGVSGDTNPLHQNQEFAKYTQFGEPIIHGMLTASLISTLIGTRLPGPGCIYMDQSLKFTVPVKVGDTVNAKVEVIELHRDRPYAILETTCSVKGEIVLTGKARVKVSRKPQTRKVVNSNELADTKGVH